MTDLPPAIQILIKVELGVVALGVIVGAVSFVVILLRTILDRTALVAPEQFRDERAEAEGEKLALALALDSAWPWYFRKQIFADGLRIHSERMAVSSWLWARLGARLFVVNTVTGAETLNRLWLFLPYPMIVLPFLLAVLLVAAACNLIYLAVEYLALAIAWLVYLPVVGALRAVEAIWLRFRHTSASCPDCFFVSERPAYRCVSCGGLHRDIRPGSLGVFQRRCECGEVMPTMVLRAAWHEKAVCQRCGEPLREGAAALRDVRVPIFGDVSSGKTRLLCASLDSITALAAEHDLAISYPDPESAERAEAALETIRASRDTTKTDAVLPRALSFRLGSAKNGTLVHLYDAAGELYGNGERHEDMGFLDNGHGLIFVVDPFALVAVRAAVGGSGSIARHLSDGDGKDPELAYSQVVSRLRDGGVEADSQRLAVVVSKVDLLTEGGVDVPTDPAEIGNWLYENGLHNVVLAAPNEFADVRYFAVASVAAARATRETDPGSPLRWLLRAQGVPLPAESVPVAVGGGGDD